MAIALPGWGWQAADGIYHICVGPARTCRMAGLGTLGDLLSEQPQQTANTTLGDADSSGVTVAILPHKQIFEIKE